MKKIVSLLVFVTLLTATFSLVYAIPAFADLKAVVDAICNADTNTIVATFGPSAFGFPGSGFGTGGDCGGFMVFMDSINWHVIHDMRTGGAWYVSTSVTLGLCPVGHACFELIFLKD